MPVQGATEYTTEHEVGVAGAVVDGQLKNIISKAAEVAIPFGRFVVRGTADGECKLPTSGLEVAVGLGFAVRMQDDVANGSDVLQYEIGRNVSILDFGVIYVVPETALTAGVAAFVRHGAGAGGSALGALRNDADTSTATQLPGIIPMKSVSAGQLCPVSVRLRA